MQYSNPDKISGWWIPGGSKPKTGAEAFQQAILDVAKPVYCVQSSQGTAVASDGTAALSSHSAPGSAFSLTGFAPSLFPDEMGDPVFKNTHGLKYAYVAGAMANGITSVEMVEAAGRARMIGFFGAAGLSLNAIAEAIGRLRQRLGRTPFGMNLIHSPNEPDHEAATVDLYLKHQIRLISASAYLGLTLPLVYYRVKGIRRDAEGRAVCPNKIIAKVSREEVAEKFFSPPPEKILRQLVEAGRITPEEAELSRSVPVAEDLTAEADSGGHTDNRPALTLFPTMTALRDRLSEKYGYHRPPCVGLGGGIATPVSAAAAFSMGAAFLVTGSVNQACAEAGTSEAVRRMLAEARQADVTMAPAADMFEMGVKVQVLKRGTMFPQRAGKLYDLYSRYHAYEEIPSSQRMMLERDFFKSGFEEAWAGTRAFFEKRDPRQNERAERDPKHKMALVFRSYLGQSSRWAITGIPDRRLDYQIWCGPAIGAFNEWVRGSFLEAPENRKTAAVAMNLLMGAAVITRANWLRSQGVTLPPGVGGFRPMPLSRIHEIIGNGFR